MHPETEQVAKSNQATVIGLWVSGLFVFFCCSCCAASLVYSEWGGLKTPGDMPARSWEHVERAGLMNPDENLVAYIDKSPFLRGTNTFLVTDERLIHHQTGDDLEIALAQVTRVDTTVDDFGNCTYVVVAESGTKIEVEVTDTEGVERFGLLLREALEQAGNDVSVDIPTSG